MKKLSRSSSVATKSSEIPEMKKNREISVFLFYTRKNLKQVCRQAVDKLCSHSCPKLSTSLQLITSLFILTDLAQVSN